MSPLRFRLRPEIHCFVHYDGRIEEWIVLVCDSLPPLKLGDEFREPWPIWEPE